MTTPLLDAEIGARTAALAEGMRVQLGEMGFARVGADGVHLAEEAARELTTPPPSALESVQALRRLDFPPAPGEPPPRTWTRGDVLPPRPPRDPNEPLPAFVRLRML